MTELIYHGNGERIDTRLTTQFPYSRNFFHHIIEREGIKVESQKSPNWSGQAPVEGQRGKVIKKSHKLSEGEVIFIDDVTRYLSSAILDEAPNIDIPIVLEKEDYLVINKLKWVLAHPNSVWDVGQPSVVWFLYHRYKDLPSIWNFIRAGLLHRLDKETDGLMIVAKTEKGLAHFKKLFQEKSEKASEISEKHQWTSTDHEFHNHLSSSESYHPESFGLRKFYRATCYLTDAGKKFLDGIKKIPPVLWPGQAFYIKELVIAKVPHTEPKMWITKIMKVSEAHRLIGTKEDVVDLELEILTWRTHQIRYHLAHHGLPIVGDYLYGKDDPDVSVPMGLTAWKLIFEDVDGKKISLEI